TDTVLDPHGGQQDLAKKIISTVTQASLADDPLRMLRAFRIQAEAGFALDPSVLSQIDSLHAGISNIAVERITEELDRIFLQPHSAQVWRTIGGTPLFDSMLPEARAM